MTSRGRVDPVIDLFFERFRAQGTLDRATHEKAYLKSELQFHGVTLPIVRATAVEAHKGPARDADAARLRAIAHGCFETDWFDVRSAAIALLEKNVKKLSVGDLPWLVDLVRASSNWAQVDWLAVKVIGPHARAKDIRTWAKDRHMWVRRTALLAQLDVLRKGGGDFALFATIAAPMLREKEFFIRKAIGWVLREVSHRRPALTFDFVKLHQADMSGLTLREATRRLPDAMQKKIARRT